MKRTKSHNTLPSVIRLGLFSMMFLGMFGCSTYQPGYHANVPTTTLPEVNRPQVKGRSSVQAHVRKSIPASVQKTEVKPDSKKSVAKVQRYTDKPKTTVITQTEVRSVLAPEDQPPIEVASEASPYDKIPDSEVDSSNETSPAVKSLMLRARADMAIGQDQSAISKLERALRIESNNSELWFLLAKAHQSSSNHHQAITMAKKSINFAGSNEALVEKSWKLIKTSGELSGDTIVVQEAINYSKVNP